MVGLYFGSLGAAEILEEPSTSIAPAAVVLITGGSAFAFHIGHRWARAVLAFTGWAAAGINVIMATAAPSAAVAVAALIAAVTCVVMAGLARSENTHRYLDGYTPAYSESLVDARRPTPGDAPPSVRLAAAYLSLLAVAGVCFAASAIALGPGVAPAALGAMILNAAAAYGLLNGRLWARAYTVVLTSLALVGTIPVLVHMWALAHPSQDGFFRAAEPAHVGQPVTLILAIATVNAAILYTVAFGGRAGNHFAHGH